MRFWNNGGVFAIVAGFAVAACDSSTDPAERGVCADAVSSISPADTSLTVGGQLTFSVALTCSISGSAVSTDWTWRSLQPDIATVDGSGTVAGLTPGVATVVGTPVRFVSARVSATVRTRPRIDVSIPVSAIQIDNR